MRGNERDWPMDGSEIAGNGLHEMTKRFKELAGPGSATAMGVLLARFTESRKPEDKRICYDPYAVHFISPSMLEWASRCPEEVKAMHEQRESLLPGLSNSIVARVRFFDDFVGKMIEEGLEQLIILGAGYDSRAYRIEGLKKIRTFEVDHPSTQILKRKKIIDILGGLPDHITYVPADLERQDLGKKLLERGYNRSKKTLFLMEGILMYIRPDTVDEIFSFISMNSGNGSKILFDYHPQSVVDGNSELEVGRNLYNHVSQLNEPFIFGIEPEDVEGFLTQRGFSKIRNVASEDYKKAYFHSINSDREVCSLFHFVHAEVNGK
jgi:methyltransferase (TIGR00027 family)